MRATTMVMNFSWPSRWRFENMARLSSETNFAGDWQWPFCSQSIVNIDWAIIMIRPDVTPWPVTSPTPIHALPFVLRNS